MDKFDLIKGASKKAPHKRQPKKEKDTTVSRHVRDNQSFYVGDARGVISKLKKGALSKAVQKALQYAYDSGELAEFLDDEQ